MNAQQREAIRQAKILRAEPDPTGLAEDVRKISCRFQIKYRCQQGQQNYLQVL